MVALAVIQRQVLSQTCSSIVQRDFSRKGFTLRDEAKAVQANVEDEERVHGQRDPVLHHAAATQDADTCRERPETQHAVDGYPHDDGDAQSAQQGGDDEREERVADDADRLEEGAVRGVLVLCRR